MLSEEKVTPFRDGEVKTTAVWVNSQFILGFAVITEGSYSFYLVPSGITDFIWSLSIASYSNEEDLSFLLLVSTAPK